MTYELHLVGLNTSLALRVMVLVDALLMGVGHVPIIRAIFFSFSIGAYFLLSTVVYVLGAIFVGCNRLFKLSNYSLIILAIVDNVLLAYTRTMPNIFFKRVMPWSWGLTPLGTGEILIGQTLLVVLCAILLFKPGLQPIEKAKTPPTASSKVQ